MKYRITDETRRLESGEILHRIVRADGASGGFVQSEKNLSQAGTCWLHGDSLAYGEARIEDAAQVYGVISGSAVARGRAAIHGRLHGHAVVEGDAKVYGNVGGSHHIGGDEVVYGNLD
ncbi:hypothetical protein [Ciceribacter ferrooxidans]|uniref:Polymer-forming cytoskeletal protein n=1 Tax=Ciceribacter ferrooxidans TaxID=2509717 RepID=A0A4Q2TDH6_9HYPH|nr:hypothetical protein [Ciceribacter ferrooxidans]RYC15239.1 hypothetical protein EUU22_09375 [Ciceribacter ferrooxidans]